MMEELNLVSFGEAVDLCKKGKKIARSGWNGKGMFIYYVPPAAYPASRNKNGTMEGVFHDDLVPYDGYLAKLTADKTVVPWQAPITDILADDWFVVEG